MRELLLSPDQTKKIKELYRGMETGYDRIAHELGHSCTGCPDNCCDSWFQHHTYCEWAFLWQGIRQLEDEQIDQIMQRAQTYVKESKALLDKGERPRLICPLNEGGLCFLYEHRMMICRMHGVPASMTRPDGRVLRFPGCHICRQHVEEQYSDLKAAPCMDRTSLFRRLASLESDLLQEQRHLYPKVKMTLAEMIVKGPPRVTLRHCER